MEEARLNHLLRGLPRETAPGGFTAQVLRRLDERPRLAPATPAIVNRARRLPQSQRWHRLMVATATVGALGVSVGVSVGVLQPERSAMPLSELAPDIAAASSPAPSAQPAPLTQAPATAGMAAASMERTFRHESGTRELPALGLGSLNGGSRRPEAMTAMTAMTKMTAGVASGRATAVAVAAPTRAVQAATPRIGAAQAQQLLRELQLERGRLERELRSLRRPGGGLPTVLYLGGDENVDLVLSTGRPRPPGAPAGERDDGENLNYL